MLSEDELPHDWSLKRYEYWIPNQMKLSAAGNTEVPAYLALKELGFSISVRDTLGGDQIWSAQKEEIEIHGSGPLELLALVKLVECRGASWQATDNEIEEFISKYC